MSYQVGIIGARFGGIGMAIALKRAGLEDFVILDRADDLGGTWRDNSYPGLTCDIPSQLYSFSFRPWRWTRRFPPREEILAYLHALVAEGSAALAHTCVWAAASRRPSSTNTARSGTSALTMAARCRRAWSSAPSASSAVPPCPTSPAGTSSPALSLAKLTAFIQRRRRGRKR